MEQKNEMGTGPEAGRGREDVPEAAPDTRQAPAGMPPAENAEPQDAEHPDFANLSKKEQRRARRRARRRRWAHVDVNDGQKSFAAGLNSYKLFWIFLIGGIIGFVFETFYVFFTTGVWMNRAGVLYGPFNQVYGLGAVLFVLLLYRFRHKNAFIIFSVAAVVGGAFEYAASWVQEFAFGSVSWEYSERAANIGGRTNVMYSLGWGLMGLIFITHTWPYLSELIERIPNKMGKPLTVVLALLLGANLLLSAAAVSRYSERARGIPANGAVTQWLDNTYPDDAMARHYPSMEFVAPADDTAPESGGSSNKDTGQAAA